MSKTLLFNYLDEHFPLNSGSIKKNLETYAAILARESEVKNLTAIEPDDYYEKHFYDSLLIGEMYEFKQKTVIDIGTGAGFPGLVLAIAYPEVDMYLLEPTAKRCEFLAQVVNVLDLKNVTIINKRAEDYIVEVRETFDIAVSRAVANLGIILELSVPFVKVKGHILLMKGRNYATEVREHPKVFDILKIMEIKRETKVMPTDKAEHINVLFYKEQPTSVIYPRHYSAIKKNPL